MKKNTLKNLFGTKKKGTTALPGEATAEELVFDEPKRESTTGRYGSGTASFSNAPASSFVRAARAMKVNEETGLPDEQPFTSIDELYADVEAKQNAATSSQKEQLTKEQKAVLRELKREERRIAKEEKKRNRGEHFGSVMSDEERADLYADSFHFSYLLDTMDDDDIISPRDAYRNRDMSMLSYLPFLFWIPLLCRPRSRFIRFHANQGLVLSILEACWWLTEYLLTDYFNTQLLYFLSILLASLNIFVLILIGFGILSCSNERARELPVIGRFRIITTIRGERKNDDW